MIHWTFPNNPCIHYTHTHTCTHTHTHTRTHIHMHTHIHTHTRTHTHTHTHAHTCTHTHTHTHTHTCTGMHTHIQRNSKTNFYLRQTCQEQSMLLRTGSFYAEQANGQVQVKNQTPRVAHTGGTSRSHWPALHAAWYCRSVMSGCGLSSWPCRQAPRM